MRFSHKIFYRISILIFVFFLAGNIYSQTSDPQIKKALQLIDLGNPKQALSDLRQISASEPKNPEAHAALALAMLETDDIANAEKEVAIAYDLERKNVLVRIARGVLAGKKRKREDAVEEFNKAIKINDKEISSYLYLGRYYLSIDSLKSAEVIFYRAQSVNANDVRPFLGLAELYEKQHILDLAIEQYQEAKKIDPKDEIVMAKLAQLYFRANKYNEAIKEWDNLSKIDPNYSRAYYEMAHIYDISDDHANAAKYAEQYVALNPDNMEGIWLSARSLAESNQYQKALPYLEKAAKVDSMRANLYLARSYFFSKEYVKANQLYAASKNLNAYDLYYYGFSLISINDTTGAIDKWKQSLIADTNHKAQEKFNIRGQIAGFLNIQKKYAEIAPLYLDAAKQSNLPGDYTDAGQFYLAANMMNEARSTFEAALKINPKFIKALVGIADVLGKNSESLGGAEKMLDSAATIAKTPEENEIVGNGYVRLAIYYYTLKDYETITSILEDKALRLLDKKSPYLINAYNVLGTAFLQLKNCKKAQEYYKKVLEINPDEDNAKKGLDYLKQICK
jgi:tetratricopeptide (TPR) repeat protein